MMARSFLFAALLATQLAWGFSINNRDSATLPTRSTQAKNNKFLRDRKSNDLEKAAWCHTDFMKELELQKASFKQFFGKKILLDSTTESFNFQHEISQYSCRLQRIMEKLMGQRRGDIIVGTGGGSATAGGGWIGESKAWPHFFEPYLKKLNEIVNGADKKYKNNTIKFYNAAHGTTNSVYNALLQSSLYPSPTPSPLPSPYKEV